MKQNKTGRPPLLKGLGKDELLRLRVERREMETLADEAAANGSTVSKEVRDRVFGEDYWLDTKWTPAELNGKRVRFNVKMGHLVGSVNGELRCKERPDGKRSIRISFFFVHSPTMGKAFFISLRAHAVDKLARTVTGQPPFALPDVIFTLGID